MSKFPSHASAYINPKKAIETMLFNRQENTRIALEVERLKKEERDLMLSTRFEDIVRRSASKMVKNREKVIDEELSVIRQISTLVRREAMAQLLKAEEDQYNSELKTLGMTFYSERL